jgi:hypothetical protein
MIGTKTVYCELKDEITFELAIGLFCLIFRARNEVTVILFITIRIRNNYYRFCCAVFFVITGQNTKANMS